MIGQYRAPYGVRMQDCSRSGSSRDRDMEQRLRRRFTGYSRQHVSVRADTKDVFGPHTALVDRTFANRQDQRITFAHDAEVTAGSQYPAAPVKIVADFDEPLCSLRKYHDQRHYTKHSNLEER